MRRSNRDVTEAELAILQVLWEEGEVTVRRLIDRLYATDGSSAHATIQKLLERLEAKGFVRRDRGGPVQVISAVVHRDELVRRRLRDVANELCGGSLSAMFSHLVNPQRLAPADRQALRTFLEKLEEGKASQADNS
jgi:BlaI family transcriptional regulator, penicillinase repressor